MSTTTGGEESSPHRDMSLAKCPYRDPLGRHRENWFQVVEIVGDQVVCGHCGHVFRNTPSPRPFPNRVFP